jgi:hypothetical protein
MQPNKGTAKPRPILSAAASQVMTNAPLNGFIASRIFPYFPVPEAHGIYPVIPAAALFNVPETKRGERGAYSRSTENFESGQFFTKENGLEMPVDQRFAKLYSSMLDLELFTTRLCAEKVLRAQEVRVAAKVFNTSNYLSTGASAAWDVASTDVKKDIILGRAILRAKGLEPNALILAYDLFEKLTLNSTIIVAAKDMFPDAAKTGTVTKAMIEAYLGVPEIVVAGAMKNTANRNKAASLSGIWSDSYAMLCRIASEGDDITEPCIGRIMRWNEGVGEEFVAETYYEDQVRADIVRNRHDTAEVLLMSTDEDSGAAKSKISYNSGLIFTGVKTT